MSLVICLTPEEDFCRESALGLYLPGTTRLTDDEIAQGLVVASPNGGTYHILPHGKLGSNFERMLKSEAITKGLTPCRNGCYTERYR